MSRYMWPSSLDHMYKHITIFPVWIFFFWQFFFWFGMQYHICMHLMPPNVSFSQNLSYTLFISFFKRTLKTLKTDKILSNEFFVSIFATQETSSWEGLHCSALELLSSSCIIMSSVISIFLWHLNQHVYVKQSKTRSKDEFSNAWYYLLSYISSNCYNY